MDTQVRTPQLIFLQAQRLTVPLFQRPYVWNEENQWAPLWADCTRVARRVLADPTTSPSPHFLGAVVLQQVQNPTGSMQERTIIDGQQRITTLQLLLDALQSEVGAVGSTMAASRLEQLTSNHEAFRSMVEDRFKVWPTNRDRPAFNEVMAAASPVDYGKLAHRGTKLVQAHQFFAERARDWLQVDGAEKVAERADAMDRAVRDLLQIVVIDLTTQEDAQEIFETLNARGAQLTAADLIKNFIFQRLLEAQVDVESAYEQHWKEFETGFWEAEVSSGRFRHSRSSIFLNHWLIGQTGEELVAREVFSRFKLYADEDAEIPMGELLARVRRSANVYRRFAEAANDSTGSLERVGLFAYRSGTLESEVFKPLLLLLLDPEREPIPTEQLTKALASLESWMVRRMLVRAGTKGYNQLAAELVTVLLQGDRSRSGDIVERFLVDQQAESRYWPDDVEVAREAATLQAYRHLRQGRLRMVLEAVEDHRRGWIDGDEGLGGQRVLRGKYAIEHITPRKWMTHWPLETAQSDAEREQSLHRFGNLTLVTKALNSKVSNGPWAAKRVELQKHDVLKLTSDILAPTVATWNEAMINERTERIVQSVLEIWKVPAGHRSGVHESSKRKKIKVRLSDLIAAGLLEPGAVLYSRRVQYAERFAVVLPDGRLDVDGQPYDTPTGAAKAICKKKTINGWWWFVLGQGSRVSLTDLWEEYVDRTSADVDEADAEGEEE